MTVVSPTGWLTQRTLADKKSVPEQIKCVLKWIYNLFEIDPDCFQNAIYLIEIIFVDVKFPLARPVGFQIKLNRNFGWFR